MTALRADKTVGDDGRSVRTPLLASVLKNLDPDRRIFVIDLGGLRPATLETFSAYRCRIDVVDLDLADFNLTPESSDPNFEDAIATFERELPELKDELADLLLCWTHLNYFSIEHLMPLMKTLLDRMNTAAQIHALIESSATDMPAAPRPLSIMPDGSLRWPPDSKSVARIPAPRHSSERLLQCVPGFSIDRTMLLSSGQKEFLFSRR